MSSKPQRKTVKLNLGCGGRPLPGYLNVDFDDEETLKARYPSQDWPEDISIHTYDIFNLPFPDSSVDEVRADALLEHLSFSEEPTFFYEIRRVLRSGGVFEFSVPDFEKVVRLWLAAEDEWKDFFREDPEAIAETHWFGQYSYSMDNRWGYLTAILFGTQHGRGQFHKNCYTVPKIRAIMQRLEFEEPEISHFLWQGVRDPMIQVRAAKK